MVAGLMLVAVAAGSWTVFASQQAQRRWVSGQIEQLLIAQPENLPEILTHLDNQAGLVVPQLRLLYQTHPQGSPARLRAALGLVPHDPQVRGDLMDAVLSVDTLPDQLKVIAGRLHIGREASPETWSAIYEDPTEDSRRRFRAFVVEVIHGPTNPRWAIWAPGMVEAFTAEPSSTWRPWLELLKPARAELLPAFKDLLDRDLLNPEPLALGIVALHPSGSAAVDYGLSKLAVWKAAAFRAMLTAITVHGYNREFTRALRRRLADEPDPWAGAAMSVALAGCADHGPLVQGYAEETESPVAIHAVNASLPNRLNFNVLRKIYEEQNLGALQDTNLRRSVLMASALQAPALVDTSLRTWLQEVALHHVVHDPDACCFSAAELILRRLGQDPMKTGRPQRRERSNPEGVLGNVLIDQSGLAFSLLPAPEPNAESRRLAVCNTELTLQEILTYLDQTPAAKIEFGGPQQVQRLDASGEPILEVPFENKRRRTDLALVYDYCNALSRQNQLPESEWCYPLLFRPEDVTQILVNREAAGFRLLTSQEWPWANRTSESLLKLVPPDGPIMLNYAWTFENANFAPQATGRRLPNAQGLFDMFGNVEEVCHSMTVDDAGFYAFGKTVRAQISALNSKPSGIGDQPLPANNLYTAYTGFRICRTVRTAN
jgi:hypothetical protein